jgi:hypothetical protein
MKTLTKRKPSAEKAGRRGDDARPPAAAIKDGTGAWSAGLWSETHAALLGRIAGLMPQVDELMADLTARLLGDAALPGRTIFRGLAGDEQRMKVLRALLGQAPGNANRADIEAAIAGYQGARRRWRAYLHGLWYTHENGRTFLAAPGGADAATFLVAREVKATELEAELARLTALGAALPRLARAQRAGRAPTPVPRAAPGKRRQPEVAKAGRPAAKGEAGMQGRRVARWGNATSSAAPLVESADGGEGYASRSHRGRRGPRT